MTQLIIQPTLNNHKRLSLQSVISRVPLDNFIMEMLVIKQVIWYMDKEEQCQPILLIRHSQMQFLTRSCQTDITY